MTTSQGKWSFCGPSTSFSFSDFAFQVQMNIITGDAGGIIFRTSSNGGYGFSITPGGSYTLFSHDPSRILLQGSSSAIRTGLNQSNFIAVLAQGNSISLYMNNQYIVTVIDNSYNYGFVGVLAIAFTRSAEVQFNNAKLWA